MKQIKLPYTPSITQEKVMEILRKEFPNKKVTKFMNLVRIKDNSLRYANIGIIHNEKKGLTYLQISSAMPLWIGITIIIPILLVGLCAYTLCGNWATQVAESLKQNLNKITKDSQAL